MFSYRLVYSSSLELLAFKATSLVGNAGEARQYLELPTASFRILQALLLWLVSTDLIVSALVGATMVAIELQELSKKNRRSLARQRCILHILVFLLCNSANAPKSFTFTHKPSIKDRSCDRVACVQFGFKSD